MRSTDPALLAIEVQPRYRDLLSGHWPVVAGPEPDELLSSWLHRLAFGNGLPPRAFGPALDLGSGAWSGRLDLALPAIVRDRLVRCTGLTPEAGRRHDARRGWGARAFVAVARRSFARAGGGGGKPPGCNSVRNVWPKTSNRISGGNGAWRRRSLCARHGSRLLDRCPACGQGLAPFNQASLRPQNDCAACGFDLASAKAPRLGAGARRAAADLADLGRRVTDANSAVVDAILALPAKLDPLRAAALTALPCVRSRPRPACAGPRHRSPVRRRDQRGRQPKAECRKMPAAPAGVLACFARGLCGRAPAARGRIS